MYTSGLLDVVYCFVSLLTTAVAGSPCRVLLFRGVDAPAEPHVWHLSLWFWLRVDHGAVVATTAIRDRGGVGWGWVPEGPWGGRYGVGSVRCGRCRAGTVVGQRPQSICRLWGLLPLQQADRKRVDKKLKQIQNAWKHNLWYNVKYTAINLFWRQGASSLKATQKKYWSATMYSKSLQRLLVHIKNLHHNGCPWTLHWAM